MNSDIKCVIFDLDGTLLYTLEDLYLSTNYALESLNYPPRSLIEVRSFVGSGIRKLIERALPDNCTDAQEEQCLDVFIAHYCKNSRNHTKPYDGINKVLDYLSKNDIKIAVNSNKIDSAVQELCSEFFSKYVSAAVGECPNCARKPNPQGVYKILNMLNLNREDVIYVGDSLTDIKTAKNASIPCISVSWGYCNKDILEQNSPNFVVSSPEELLEFFKTNIKNCKAKTENM